MEVTRVKIKPGDTERVLAYVDIELDDEFVIRGAPLARTPSGEVVLTMPNKQMKGEGKWIEHCHPVTLRMRQKLEVAVFSAYEAWRAGLTAHAAV